MIDVYWTMKVYLIAW